MRDLPAPCSPRLPREAALADEAALVAAAKRDRHEFTPLYRHYVGRIYAYCFQRLGTREAAEDVTSRTFEQALRQLHTCRDEAFRGWRFTIATHAIADHFRVTHHARSHVALEHVRDTPERGPLVEDAAMAEEAAEQLHALLHHLPADQRRVLELRAAGLRGEEIAVALERSHAAIRMLQLRAVRHLRALLRVDELPGTAP